MFFIVNIDPAFEANLSLFPLYRSYSAYMTITNASRYEKDKIKDNKRPQISLHFNYSPTNSYKKQTFHNRSIIKLDNKMPKYQYSSV